MTCLSPPLASIVSLPLPAMTVSDPVVVTNVLPPPSWMMSCPEPTLMVSLPEPNARTESSPLPNAIIHAPASDGARATMSLPPPPMMLPAPPEAKNDRAPSPTRICWFASLLA